MHRRIATLHARRAALLRDLAVVEDEFAAALRAAADGAERGEWVRLEQWARERGYSPDHVRSRIALLKKAGDARKAGSRWEIRRVAEMPGGRHGHKLRAVDGAA